jgi:hypothetical protein
MIVYQAKKGVILSILAYFIFVEAKFKLTKKQKKSSDLYSLLLLYPTGGHSLFLLPPAGGNSSLLLYLAGGHSLVLLSLAGKQFDRTFYREETNLYLFPPAG